MSIWCLLFLVQISNGATYARLHFYIFSLFHCKETHLYMYKVGFIVPEYIVICVQVCKPLVN